MGRDNQYKHGLRNLIQSRHRRVYIYALPSLLTSANLLFGFLAIIFSIDGHFQKASWAIILATVFDMLDGRLARLTKTTTRFGMELDSLCDLVSFGMAPAILIYEASLRSFNRLGLAVVIIFTLCGAFRLARFNVLSEVLPKSYFQGLPIPAASASIATLFFFSKGIEYELDGSIFVLVFVFLLSLLMVSKVRFSSFKRNYSSARPFRLVALLIVMVIALILWFEVSAFLLLQAYILYSLSLECFRYNLRSAK